MKSIRSYLIVVSALLVVALGFGVYVWYVLQKLGNEVAPQPIPEIQTRKEAIELEETPESDTLPVEQLSVDQLSEPQQEMLGALGVEAETLSITPQMIACAEDAIGKEAVAEIASGRAPGPIESIKLLGCAPFSYD